MAGLVIVLYNPRSSASRKPILPLSLVAIGANLEPGSWCVVDGNLEDHAARAIVDALQRGAGPPILGVTSMPGPQLADAVPVCRAVRQRLPEVTIVWGGYFPTQHWKPLIRSDVADYVIRGHGDVAFRELLEALAADRDVRGIPGVACVTADGELHSSPLGAVPHPARLPRLPLETLPLERYVRDTFLGSRTLGYHSSYGCPFTCNFCAVVNMVEGRWFPQSAEQVVDVVRDYVATHAVNAVEFYDNNFFVSQRRVAAFSEAIAPLGIAWWGEGRVDTLLRYRDETWRLMRDSGLRMVFMGAESGSAETLERMDKGGTLRPEDTLELVGRMRAWGIVPELSFVLGSPPDPLADIERTLEFVRQVKRVNPKTEIILYLYTPEPLKGELLDAARETGFSFPETLDGWLSDEWSDVTQRRSRQLPWVTPRLLDRLRGFERVLNARYPTSTDASLARWQRGLLRAAGAWRWQLRAYRWPLELRGMQRVFRYQRPETSGF